MTAHYLLGSTLNHLGDKLGARAHYTAALRLNPDYKLAREALAGLGNLRR